ncbi:MAG: hypothetical protein ACREOO_12470 [bacterium]
MKQAFFAVAFFWAVGASIGVGRAQSPKEMTLEDPSATAFGDTLPAPVIDENAASSRMFLDKIEVLGTIAKPQALFIIPGRDPKVDGIEIDRSFFHEVFRPIEKDYHPANTRRYLKDQVVW